MRAESAGERASTRVAGRVPAESAPLHVHRQGAFKFRATSQPALKTAAHTPLLHAQNQAHGTT